jgi:cell division septation protein DedD
VPSVATSASGSWRVQLGAFRDEANAKALWNTVSARLGGSYQPYLVRGGDVTRLQAGPLRSEADAERLCGKIRSGGQACLVKHN